MEYVDGPVTQPFGAGKEFAWQLGYGHLGEDKGVPVGTVARSIADGEVIFAGWARDCPAHLKNAILVMGDAPGIFVWAAYNDQNGPWEALTCHLSETPLNAGDRIRRGQVIGRSGNTGLSTGPHTHYETFTRPCSNVPPFSRYNPRLQIANEDARFPDGPPPPPPVGPNERITAATALQRNAPNRDGQVIRTIEPGKKERFDGWVRGENVLIPGESGVRPSFESDVWFKDADGFVWAGGFTDFSTNGLPNLTPVPGPNQRRVISGGAVQRSTPATGGDVVRSIIGDTLETFTHWARGESVDGTDVWFKDNLGYVSASRFENRSTDGMPEFSTLAANQRRVGSGGAQQRNAPNRNGAVVRTVAPNTTETFTHWTKGENVVIPGEAGVRPSFESDLWYRDIHGYVWAGAFTTQTKAGLAEHVHGSTPPAPLPTTPAPTPGADYVFAKAFPMVTEVRPAAQGNFEVGNFPAAKDVKAIFVHQFNADEVADNPTVNKVTVHLDSVIQTFQGTGRVASADFGVEGTRVVQFVKVAATGGDRAYAQGSPANGEAWSIETYGAQDPVTMATVAKLIRELEKLGGKKQLRKHLEVMATKCGNGVDLVKYRALVTALEATPVIPPPVVTPPPAGPAVPADSPAEVLLKQVQKMIGDYFAGRK